MGTSSMTARKKFLDRLQENGFQVNPLKCEWAVQHTDWLEYWLTPTGLKPWKKKVDGIINMDRPQNIKQLQSFLGAINYYRDMWPWCSHLLKPLTDLMGKGKWVWNDKHQKAFEEMKAFIAADALMQYSDHNLPFEIHAHASNYQLGAAILQNGKPVAYYSRKLSKTQQNYSTMEKELLSIVSVLNEFHSMLLSLCLTIYTDHKNLTYHTLNNSCVFHWCLFLEEYDATYIHIQGKDNVLADAFSHLPWIDNSTEGKRNADSDTNQPSTIEDSLFSSIADDSELLDCFLNFPLEPIYYPFDLQWLLQNQFEDQELNQR